MYWINNQQFNNMPWINNQQFKNYKNIQELLSAVQKKVSDAFGGTFKNIMSYKRNPENNPKRNKHK